MAKPPQNGKRTIVQERITPMEERILKSTEPIDVHNMEEIEFGGAKSFWINKNELDDWEGGEIPIADYPLNMDDKPEIIKKPTSRIVEYTQELFIRYLRPATPPEPGHILIKLENCQTVPPAPPLIIRQQPPRPPTPEPIVFREAPPEPPPLVGNKLIILKGERLPPPPRKVIVERLPILPQKPQSILVERWLPYPKVKRKVIFKSSPSSDPNSIIKPKNVIVQWLPPRVHVNKKITHLGIVKANPDDYRKKFGDQLLSPQNIPHTLRDIKAPNGLVLAADQEKQVPELYGDVNALTLIDLEAVNLREYRPQILKLINSHAHEYFTSPSSNGDDGSNGTSSQ